MARKFFRKYMPHPSRIHENKWLSLFGRALHRPDLWHLNHRSVAKAFAIGIFWALIPIPFQMIPAAACAIRFRANLALAVALVWLSNPFTMPPLYYGTYRLGRWVLGTNAASPPDVEAAGAFHWSVWREVWDWLWGNLSSIWMPLYFGSILAGILLSLGSYLLIRTLWRWNCGRRWERRRFRRLTAAAAV